MFYVTIKLTNKFKLIIVRNDNMGDILISIYNNWDYFTVALGYMTCILVFSLGVKYKRKSNKIMSVSLFILVTLLLITKILHI